MARSNEEIVALYRDRVIRSTAHKSRAREVRDMYHGDLVLPMTEIDELQKPTVANLVQLGTDQTARRIASTMPANLFRADSDTQAARNRARARRSIVDCWHEEVALRAKTHLLCRHYCAYANSILTLTPGDKGPRWKVRDPLDTYAADIDQEDSTAPDAIFESKRTCGWLRSRFPELPIPSRRDMSDEMLMTMLEYLDADERVVICTWGNDYDTSYGGDSWGSARVARSPLDLEYSPIAFATRPGLSRSSGQMDGVIGAYWGMAMLNALEMLAVKKSVFNDEWFVSKDGTVPQIVKEADGLRGKTGVVSGGTPWVNTTQPGFMAPQAIDRYERDIRTTAIIPAEFGGESASNVRTGRRGDAILSAAIDFVVQEAQEAIGPLIKAANLAAIDFDRKWYNKARKVYWLRQAKSETKEYYEPVALWAEGAERHQVAYSYAGSDANTLIIGIGQRLGIETMSRQSAMEIDPLIDDAEAEQDLITSESLNRALLMGLSAQVQSGAIPPSDVARIAELVQNDKKSLADAVAQVQKEAQARQAAQVAPTDPAAQPGIAQPGAGAESQAAVAPPSPGQKNITSLFSSLGMQGLQMRQGQNA